MVASATGRPGRPIALPIPHARLWSPADPFLYGLRIRLVSGGVTEDRVQSYFGMRSISLGRVGGSVRILLNGHFLFQSGALDQGYWPDGLYTAPTDAALRFDLESAKQLGYDMLRMHVEGRGRSLVLLGRQARRARLAGHAEHAHRRRFGALPPRLRKPSFAES